LLIIKYKFRIDKNLYNINNNIILRKPQNESEKTYIAVNDLKKWVKTFCSKFLFLKNMFERVTFLYHKINCVNKIIIWKKKSTLM